MQSSGDPQDIALVEEDVAVAMGNIPTPQASHNVGIEEVSSTEVSPQAPPCSPAEQTFVSESVQSKSVNRSTEDSSFTEKRMSVLDAVQKSGDQGVGKDTAMASSTGKAQVLIVKVPVKEAALMLYTVPVLSAVTCTEKVELSAQTHVKENVFSRHESSKLEQFPALVHTHVEECPVQRLTENNEPSIKTHIEEENLPPQTPGKKEGLPAWTHIDTEDILVLTLAAKAELLAQSCITNEELSSHAHVEKDAFPVQTHVNEAKLPAQTCKEEEFPVQNQNEKIELSLRTPLEKQGSLSQNPDKREEPSAQTHNEKDGLSAQMNSDEAEPLAQTCVEGKEFSVKKEDFPSFQKRFAQTHTNQHEGNHLEETDGCLSVTQGEGDWVEDGAVAQPSEEDRILKGVRREINEHAKGKEFSLDESQKASLESVAPVVEEQNGPDEKPGSVRCKSRAPSKKSVSFSEDVENFVYEPRENSSIPIHAFASSPVCKQELAKPGGRVLQEEEKIAAGYENSPSLKTSHCETKEEEKSESAHGQKDDGIVKQVLNSRVKQVTKMKRKVNTASAPALQK